MLYSISHPFPASDAVARKQEAVSNSKRYEIFLLTTSSDDGFQKPTLIPYVPTGTLQIPSNVTRISRALRKSGLDGVNQIIYYHAGVGTGSSMLDSVTGGLLGAGISENIREAYSFIAANYVSGDEM